MLTFASNSIGKLSRSTLDPIARYSTALEPISNDPPLTYTGPNLRAFLAAKGIEPSRWRDILRYNRIGSVFDLEEGASLLFIPDKSKVNSFDPHPDE
jgi:hypothetical protein